MISVVFGIAILAAGVVGLWYFMPGGGKVHPLARQPFIETVIPVAIVSALGAGLGDYRLRNDRFVLKPFLKNSDIYFEFQMLIAATIL